MPAANSSVCLIGYGLAGSAFHAPLIASTPGLQLSFVVTRDAQRAGQVRRAYPGATVLASTDDVWERADEIDLVVVASPNKTHVPFGLAAVEAGLAAVVDKPLARTYDEGRALVDAAAERGVLLSAFHNRRWDGDLLTVRRLLADGELGEVHRFESRYERWRPEPQDRWRESGDPDEGGGLLLDLGSHLVDQAMHLFGPVTEVYAELDRRRPDAQVEDDVLLALTHASGVRSALSASAVAGLLGPRMRVLGNRQAYVKYGLDGQEDALRSGQRPDAAAGWGEEAPEHWGTVGAGDTARTLRTEPGDCPAFYAGVAAALRGKGPNPVTGEEALAVLRVLDAARLSAGDRRIVAMTGV